MFDNILLDTDTIVELNPTLSLSLTNVMFNKAQKLKIYLT
jgi:hypothetical protein